MEGRCCSLQVHLQVRRQSKYELCRVGVGANVGRNTHLSDRLCKLHPREAWPEMPNVSRFSNGERFCERFSVFPRIGGMSSNLPQGAEQDKMDIQERHLWNKDWLDAGIVLWKDVALSAMTVAHS